jgi:glycosyltransferase involved in cell wall biosynthesis
LPDELVVGDDGSTDRTLEIVSRFAATAPFPVQVGEGPRQGLAANFLSAARRATGDLIAFSDQDDIWVDRKLRVTEAALLATRAGLVFHASRAVDEQLRPVRIRYQPTRRHNWPPCTRNIWAPLAGNTMLVHRRVIERCDWQNLPVSQWYPGALANHDEYVSLIAAASEVNVRIADRLILYRQHGTNAAGGREFGVPPSSWSRGSYRDYVLHRAEAARNWATQIVPSLDRTDAAAATAYYLAAERMQNRRAQFLEASRLGAAGLWMAHSLGGDYRSSTPSGLGWRALLRDGYHLARRFAGQS